MSTVSTLLSLWLLKGKRLTSKPVDGMGNELLLDILAKLVVKLEALLDVGSSIVVALGRVLRRGEEVEERLSGNSLLNNTGLLGSCF